MASEDVLTFGRGGDCDIRFGHAPVHLPAVPRLWGEISWHRGAMDVSNLSPRWGLTLLAEDTGPGRVDIPAGGRGSYPTSRFEIVAQAPEVEFKLHVQTAPPRSTYLPSRPARPTGVSGTASQRGTTGPRNRDPLPNTIGTEDESRDVPSFVPFTLTPTQKVIGSAVVAPLSAGKPRRAGYAEVAIATHYAERTVREAVAAMDALFVVHRLADRHASGDALDRVALVLRRHAALLDGPVAR